MKQTRLNFGFVPGADIAAIMSGRLSVDQFFEAGWVPVRSDRFDEAAVEVGVDAKNVIERRQRVLGFLAIGTSEPLPSQN